MTLVDKIGKQSLKLFITYSILALGLVVAEGWSKAVFKLLPLKTVYAQEGMEVHRAVILTLFMATITVALRLLLPEVHLDPDIGADFALDDDM